MPTEQHVGMPDVALRTFETAVQNATRLDAAVRTLGGAARHALLVRHALLATSADLGAVRALILGGTAAVVASRPDDTISLTGRLAAAGLAGAVPPRVGEALEAIWLRDVRHTASLLNAAEAAGHIVAAAPASSDSQRAAALAGAMCLAKGGLVAAPFLTVWQLDAAARSAAVQVDRSQAWSEWVRAWCSLLAREATNATHALRTAEEQFAAERAMARSSPRTGGTDDLVLAWLHATLTFTIRDASAALGLSTPTVGTSIARLEKAGFAEELTGQARDRVWTSTALLKLVQTR